MKTARTFATLYRSANAPLRWRIAQYPGHWEGDLLYGNATSQIATLVERQSRFVMLVKVASKDCEAVVNALLRHASKLPRELYKSLTWDRGSEMADHNRFTVATDIKVHFCDPQHPWRRDLNENTNGLLRQYFPKGTDLSAYLQTSLNVVARRLNERPRKTLNFDTPAERFHQTVASTGCTRRQTVTRHLDPNDRQSTDPTMQY
ncbi:IS30 family transposase [Paraburkholderia strydomiana]|nr:IS30 family transposase [Paraburkholderia strydomiana]